MSPKTLGAFFKACSLKDKLLNSMKTLLPKMDGKIVLDIGIDKASGWIDSIRRRRKCNIYSIQV